MESLGTGADGRQASGGALSSGEEQERARSSGARELEQLKGFTYHLMLMNELLAGWRLQEIEAAILAATALTAHRRNDILHRITPSKSSLIPTLYRFFLIRVRME